MLEVLTASFLLFGAGLFPLLIYKGKEHSSHPYFQFVLRFDHFLYSSIIYLNWTLYIFKLNIIDIHTVVGLEEYCHPYYLYFVIFSSRNWTGPIIYTNYFQTKRQNNSKYSNYFFSNIMNKFLNFMISYHLSLLSSIVCQSSQTQGNIWELLRNLVAWMS